MPSKSKFIISSIAGLFVFLSFCLGQKNEISEDSVLWHKLHLWGTDTYPKSIRDSAITVVTFCKIVFKEKNKIDSIFVYNTDNEEIIGMITSGVQTINYSKFKQKFSFLLIPFVFKNINEPGSNSISIPITNMSYLFDSHIEGKRKYSCKFIRPVITVFLFPRKVK